MCEGNLLVMASNAVPCCIAHHYNDVIMGAIAFQITSLTIVYSTVYSGADQRKHQSSASLAFVRAVHRWPVNSPHKGPVTQKMFPFGDVIMNTKYWGLHQNSRHFTDTKLWRIFVKDFVSYCFKFRRNLFSRTPTWQEVIMGSDNDLSSNNLNEWWHHEYTYFYVYCL